MNHFKSKTTRARQVLTEMKVKLSKFTGQKVEQENRLEEIDKLINYTMKLEIEREEHLDKETQLIMIIGDLKAQLNEMARLYHISEKVNEKGVEMATDEFFDAIEQRVRQENKNN